MNLISDEKHYNTLNLYYKEKFGCKIAKISLNGKFTCPNKDGTKGYGGCIYCSKMGSGDLAGNINLSFKEQFDEIKNKILVKWPSCKFIPYLQSNSNTYDSLENLQKIYEEVLSIDDNIVGLSIATRPDCITKEIANLLGSINKRIPVSVELGLQTSNEETGKLINRCSNNNEFSEATKLLHQNDIEIIVHIINGLPYETKEDMINTIKFVNKHDVQGIKIHSLLILKETKLAQMYEENPFKILTLEEYVDIVVTQIANLRKDIIIHRLAADSTAKDLIAPKWTMKKLVVMNEIDKALRAKNIYQGDSL